VTVSLWRKLICLRMGRKPLHSWVVDPLLGWPICEVGTLIIPRYSGRALRRFVTLGIMIAKIKNLVARKFKRSGRVVIRIFTEVFLACLPWSSTSLAPKPPPPPYIIYRKVESLFGTPFPPACCKGNSIR
jgi:hypothetical protein